MSLDGLDLLLERAAQLQSWAVHAGISTPPGDAVHAPWTSEQVHRLNMRQRDERVASYRCPVDNVDLYATRYGWICAKNRHRWRQDWALERHINQPFIPPPRAPREEEELE